MISTHLELPWEGHLEQVLSIFGYLKTNKKMSLMNGCSYSRISSNIFNEYDWFDFYMDIKEYINHNMPEARENEVFIYMFVDTDLAGDRSTRWIQTGLLIFINNYTIHWYSKRQANIEASTFRSEFCAIKADVYMIEDLNYKIRMFGIPI